MRLNLELGTHNCPGVVVVGVSDGAGGELDAEVGARSRRWHFMDWGDFVEKLAAGRRCVNYYQDVAVLAYNGAGAAGAAGVPAAKEVLDLTSQMAADGTLAWDAPAGGLDHRADRAYDHGEDQHHGAPDSARGWRGQVFRKTLEAYWKTFPQTLIDDAGRKRGRRSRHWRLIHEAGLQDWTPLDKCEEFTKRRGYDPLPWPLTRMGIGRWSRRP